MSDVYVIENRRHQRSLIAGWTDFTGAGLDDMLFHLHRWYGDTAIAIATLKKCLERILAKADKSQDTERVAAYVATFTDAFYFYLKEFERLIKELQNEVAERHVESVLQIFESSRLQEVHCKHYEQDYLKQIAKESSIFRDLELILIESENLVLDYRDLPKFARRLRALVGIKNRPNNDIPVIGNNSKSYATAESSSNELMDLTEALELKPNVFGIGVNLNYLLKLLKGWWKSRER